MQIAQFGQQQRSRLPGMPDFVTLTIAVDALNIVGLPVISPGLLIMSNQKKLLGKYCNNWFENVALGAATMAARGRA